VPLTAPLVPYHLVYQRFLEVLLFLVHPQDLALQEVLEGQEVLPRLEDLGAPHFQAYPVVQSHPATEFFLMVCYLAELRPTLFTGKHREKYYFLRKYWPREVRWPVFYVSF
jgi:hypothetical protein